jgi:cell division protein FtsX
MSDIDPIQFGRLTAQVSTLEDQVSELRSDVKALLELANQSKGGFWAGMAIASALGGAATLIIEFFFRR